MWLLDLLLVFFSSSCSAFLIHPDEIVDLPGLSLPLNYRHYSGYLNASETKHLHYWFIESQSSPSTDPLLLWMPGGPGCSGIDSILEELGPVYVTDDGNNLYSNIYSWNRAANVLFLDSPAGVGFSYSDDGQYETDDDTTSADNYAALQHFFQKFPQFKGNDFYITGESYGGNYILTLSVRVLTGPAQINFKGFAIGNGCLDVASISNSIVFFAYYHGLIGVRLWKDISMNCCDGGIASKETCNFIKPTNPKCADAVSQVTRIVSHSSLNIYSLYSECANSKDKCSLYSIVKRNSLLPLMGPDQINTSTHAPPCGDTSNVRNFLNLPSVRIALHIPSKVPTWEPCSSAVQDGYRKQYDTMRPQVLQLLSFGIRGLFYTGDVDMACNFLGAEWFADDLGLQELKDYSPWTFNNQIAGFVKYFSKNLTFLTVKGAGHRAPQDKPEAAFKMITSFINNKPY